MTSYTFTISGSITVEAPTYDEALDQARFRATVEAGHDYLDFELREEETDGN